MKNLKLDEIIAKKLSFVGKILKKLMSRKMTLLSIALILVIGLSIFFRLSGAEDSIKSIRWESPISEMKASTFFTIHLFIVFFSSVLAK